MERRGGGRRSFWEGQRGKHDCGVGGWVFLTLLGLEDRLSRRLRMDGIWLSYCGLPTLSALTVILLYYFD
jgi:hypothetical protein